MVPSARSLGFRRLRLRKCLRVMVAETVLQWQDNYEPALLQVSIMDKGPDGSPFVYVCLRAAGANHKCLSITRRVTDPSKAVIGEVKVAAVNLGFLHRFFTPSE